MVHAIQPQTHHVLQGTLDKLVVQNTTINAILFLIQQKQKG